MHDQAVSICFCVLLSNSLTKQLKKTHSKKMFLTRASKVREHLIESQESHARVVGGKTLVTLNSSLLNFFKVSQRHCFCMLK